MRNFGASSVLREVGFHTLAPLNEDWSWMDRISFFLSSRYCYKQCHQTFQKVMFKNVPIFFLFKVKDLDNELDFPPHTF